MTRGDMTDDDKALNQNTLGAIQQTYGSKSRLIQKSGFKSRGWS